MVKLASVTLYWESYTETVALNWALNFCKSSPDTANLKYMDDLDNDLNEKKFAGVIVETPDEGREEEPV